MYHIYKDGTEIGATERLTMAVKQSNGCTVINKDGNLLAFGGEVYNIEGKPQTEGFDQCFIVWQDDVPVLKATLEEQSIQIAEAEDAACEMDTANDARFTDIENVLCEMDSAESEV